MLKPLKAKTFDPVCRLNIRAIGVVQGLGVRPALYAYSLRLGVAARICNHGDALSLIVEARTSLLNFFKDNLKSALPDGCSIRRLDASWHEACGMQGVKIESSSHDSVHRLSIPPDQVVCDLCKNDFFSINNRRYLYPFTACPNCGPKFTLIERLPYDRENTVMKDFTMCEECRKEYADPKDRRFHGQNNSCFTCGPKVTVKIKHSAREYDSLDFSSPVEEIQFVVEQLRAGKVIAIKGVGGYQLVCYARSPSAIKKIRQIKERPHRPLALMVGDQKKLDENDEILSHLRSKGGPIVFIEGIYDLPVELLAPDTGILAVFLPTTPLHYYLSGAGVVSDTLDFLVVTSGNKKNSPMILHEDEAVHELGDMVDIFIHHNRQIVRSVDDSLIITDTHQSKRMPDVHSLSKLAYQRLSKAQILRRARGYVPGLVAFNYDIALDETDQLIAFGSDLKNTFCLAKGRDLLVSPHIGTLHAGRTYRHYVQCVEDLLRFFQFTPKKVVVDLHPEYLSSQYGKSWARDRGLSVLYLQHHVAHAVAVMGEYSLTKAIALTFDGTGYGSDHNLWGGECLIIDLPERKWDRIASLMYSVLLGGEAAISEPSRQVYARLLESGFFPEGPMEWMALYENKVLYPQTSSMGRLFDAVAALLMPKYGKISFEGQAAVALEALAYKGHKARKYTIAWEGDRVDTRELFSQIYGDVCRQIAIEDIALGFHDCVAEIAKDMILRAQERNPIGNVCLAGGVFQNQLLRRILVDKLLPYSLNLYTNWQVPCGDGGVSFGQAVYGLFNLSGKRNFFDA
ncbi:MAG: carbamoyltransferase HypF [Bdellovibrionota bacterium]